MSTLALISEPYPQGQIFPYSKICLLGVLLDRQLSVGLGEEFDSLGITFQQFRVINRILLSPTIRMAGIAREFYLQPASIGELVKKMEGRNIIERKRIGPRAGGECLIVTPVGREIFTRYERKIAELFKPCFGSNSLDDIPFALEVAISALESFRADSTAPA